MRHMGAAYPDIGRLHVDRHEIVRSVDIVPGLQSTVCFVRQSHNPACSVLIHLMCSVFLTNTYPLASAKENREPIKRLKRSLILGHIVRTIVHKRGYTGRRSESASNPTRVSVKQTPANDRPGIRKLTEGESRDST